MRSVVHDIKTNSGDQRTQQPAKQQSREDGMWCKKDQPYIGADQSGHEQGGFDIEFIISGLRDAFFFKIPVDSFSQGREKLCIRTVEFDCGHI